MPLKINLEDLGPEEDEAFSNEGVRVGALLVSSQGLRTSMGGPSYVLSPADLIMLPEKEGGFLGKGSSGVVWQAVNQKTGTRVAVKEIKVTSQAHLTEIRRELETLYDSTAQASPHIVDFYGAYTYEGSVFIAVECMDGTLADLPTTMPLDVLAHVTRSVLRGLVYLHRLRHLIHRDLKPSNVLFKRATGDVKIADFGVSSNLECTKGDAHSFVGTVTYMSPERLVGDVYSYAADIWSLGLVVAELALGSCPYPVLRSESTEARFWSLLQHLKSAAPALELPPNMDPQLADFISKCVAKEPEDRPSCTTLLTHPFITERCHTDGADPYADAADHSDRDAMKAWLDRLTDEAHRRERKGQRRQGRQMQGSHLAVSSPTAGPAHNSDGSTDGEVHSAATNGICEQQLLEQGHSNPACRDFLPATGSGEERMQGTRATNGLAVDMSAADPIHEGSLSSATNSHDDDIMAAGAHPLNFHRHVETEPSVNLDEELDKLLL